MTERSALIETRSGSADGSWSTCHRGDFVKTRHWHFIMKKIVNFVSYVALRRYEAALMPLTITVIGSLTEMVVPPCPPAAASVPPIC